MFRLTIKQSFITLLKLVHHYLALLMPLTIQRACLQIIMTRSTPVDLNPN